MRDVRLALVLGVLASCGPTSTSDHVAPATSAEKEQPSDPVQPAPSRGSWTFSSQLSASTGLPEILATLQANGPEPAPGNIWISCKDGEKELTFELPETMEGWKRGGSTRDVKVSLSWDDRPPEAMEVPVDTWDVVTISDAPMETLVRRMATASSLVIEAPAMSGKSVRADFKIAGLSAHLPDIEAACGWKSTQ